MFLAPGQRVRPGGREPRGPSRAERTRQGPVTVGSLRRWRRSRSTGRRRHSSSGAGPSATSAAPGAAAAARRLAPEVRCTVLGPRDNPPAARARCAPHSAASSCLGIRRIAMPLVPGSVPAEKGRRTRAMRQRGCSTHVDPASAGGTLGAHHQRHHLNGPAGRPNLGDRSVPASTIHAPGVVLRPRPEASCHLCHAVPGRRSAGVVVPLVKKSVKARAGERRE